MRWGLNSSFSNIDRALRLAARSGDEEALEEIGRELAVLDKVFEAAYDEARLRRRSKTTNRPEGEDG